MRKIISATIGAAGLLICSSNAFAFFGEAPQGVYVRSMSYGGSGCPQGSVGKTISSDGSSFTLIFDEYIAEAGYDIPRSAGRKTCQVTMDIRVPRGYQYSIATLDTRGYVSLDRGARAYQKSTYYFDRFYEGTFVTNFRGPIDEDYTVTDEVELESGGVWSPCGSNRLLNIKTEIGVRGRRGNEGMLTVDSLDGYVKQIYGLRWRACSWR